MINKPFAIIFLVLTLTMIQQIKTDEIKKEEIKGSKQIQTPGVGAPETPVRRQAFLVQQDVSGLFSALQDQQTSSEQNGQQLSSFTNVNSYSLATYFFNSQYYFPVCERCKKLQYFAFRVGSYYLTARPNQLRLQFASSSGPSNNQLFTGQQQIDGTWAFKSLSQNRYIRASNDGTTINYQYFVGAWQRWYMQRHGNHVHIQSAQFVFHWWVFDGFVLEQLNGGASAVVVQYWPKLQWLWNW